MENIEGMAARKAAGAASKPGRVAGVVQALFADKLLGSGKGGAKKTGTDYYNEEQAKRFDFKREQSRERRAISSARKIKAEGLSIKETYSQTPDAGTARTSYYQSNPPKSSGGQGTSGNKRGAQFREKKPRAPRKPRVPKETGSGELLV